MFDRLSLWPAAGHPKCAVAAMLLIMGAHGVTLSAEEPPPPDHVQKGAVLFADNCAPCHGSRMEKPGGGDVFDLRTFPPAQRSRFFKSVSNGKNNMPPWRSVLSEEEIGYLFAYVVAGEKR